MADETNAAASKLFGNKTADKPVEKTHLDSQLDPAGTPKNPLPTADDLGVDIDPATDFEKITDLDAVAKNGNIGADDSVIYSSHPMQNYEVGPYKFEKGVMTLGADAAGEFDTFLKTLPLVEQRGIRKVSRDAAEQAIKDYQALQGGATQAVDSSVDKLGLQALRGANPTVGVQDVAHAALPQQDQNTPVIATPAVDPEGKTGLDQGAHTPPA